MNGAHDLGGNHGYTKIDSSQTENFVESWEQKVFGLTLACGMLGKWNLDQSRFARERCDPAEYLSSTYYEHWLHGLELLLVERGVVTEEELRSGVSNGVTDLHSVAPEKLDGVLSTGAPTVLKQDSNRLFSVGDHVVVVNNNPQSHTRAPRYVRGRVGKVISHHGAHIFADEHSASGNKSAEHLYGVRFESSELWGEGEADNSAVFLDLFEPYLISLNQSLIQMAAKCKGRE